MIRTVADTWILTEWRMSGWMGAAFLVGAAFGALLGRIMRAIRKGE